MGRSMQLTRNRLGHIVVFSLAAVVACGETI